MKIEAFLTKCDLAGVHYLREGHHHSRPGWIQFNCPQCSDGRSGWHLGLSIDSGAFTCWRCGTLPRWKTCAALGLPPGITLSFLGEGPETWVRHATNIRLPIGAGPLQTPHREYLEERGFDPDYLEKEYHIRGTGPTGRHRWRIVIPIFDAGGALVSWTTRAISRRKPRYLSCPSAEELTPHKRVLYGENLCAGDTIFITEGPLDAWALGPPAVATFGVAITDFQVRQMAKYRRVRIWLDPDLPGKRAAKRLANNLSVLGLKVEILFSDKDPAEARQMASDVL